ISLASICSSRSPSLTYLFNSFIFFFSCTFLSISFSSSSGKCTINSLFSLSSSSSLCLSSSTTSSSSLSISLATADTSATSPLFTPFLASLLTSSKHLHSSAASHRMPSPSAPAAAPAHHPHHHGNRNNLHRLDPRSESPPQPQNQMRHH
ncbi:hypothetical protein V8G54_032691, partial [Vigna mungo]